MKKFFNKIASAWKRLPKWFVMLIFLILGIGIGVGVFYGVWNYKLKNRYQLPTPVVQNENKPPSKVVVPTSTPPEQSTSSTIPDVISGPLPFVQNPDNTKLILDMEWLANPEFYGIKKALGSAVGASKNSISKNDYYALNQWLDDQGVMEYEKGKNNGTWLLGKVKSGKYTGSLFFIRHVSETSFDKYYRVLVSADGKQARLLDSMYIEPDMMGDPYDMSSPEERLLFIEAYGLTWPKVPQGMSKTSTGKSVRIEGVGLGGDLLLDWLQNGEDTVVPAIGTLKDGRKIYGRQNDTFAYAINNGGQTLWVASIIPEKADQTMITWDTKNLLGRTLAKRYGLPVGGCGGSFWTGSPAESENLSQDNLISIGKTSEGDSVYILKDASKSPTLQGVYDGWYLPESTKKSSYEEFIQKRIPVIFWKDAFGRWAYYIDSEVLPMTECGKPVIYLYPTKTTNVSVKLPSFINVTVSDPAYPSRGWNVVAHPDGSLSYSDGKTYGSLYWEGTGVGYVAPREGFVVKDGEQESFLKSTLAKYGLNQKESQEFMDFWLPLMTGSPYYRVSFLTDTWSKAAPLNVWPKPDTNIRIFMDWQKLSAPIKIAEPKIVTPTRTGFTLVEWGGLLYR